MSKSNATDSGRLVARLGDIPDQEACISGGVLSGLICSRG